MGAFQRPMKNTEQNPESFLTALTTLPEREMRKQCFSRKLSPLEPQEIVDLFAYILREAALERTICPLESVLAEAEFLKKTLGEKKYRLTYEAALGSELKWVSVFFTALPPRKTGPYGYDSAEEAQMEQITLGQRRSMSKGWHKSTLLRLLSDPDPVVVTNILNNTRTTETEVLRVASKRPNSAKLLNIIAIHRRWSSNYNVKKALVMNPYMLPAVSVALLTSMLGADLREITRNKTLHLQLSLTAKDILELRDEALGSVSTGCDGRDR